MTYSEGARLIKDAEELKGIVEDTHSNPTVERLIFLETKGKNGEEGKLFPCCVEAWTVEDLKPDGYQSVMFRCSLLQYRKEFGEFGMVRANIREWEINRNKRFWDKPPKKSVREETPWEEAENQLNP